MVRTIIILPHVMVENIPLYVHAGQSFFILKSVVYIESSVLSQLVFNSVRPFLRSIHSKNENSNYNYKDKVLKIILMSRV